MLILVIVIVIVIIALITFPPHEVVEGYRSVPSQSVRNPFASRSVELYNPSPYNGMFTRKIITPLEYTRTNTTFPLSNQLSITKRYDTQNPTSMNNLITPLWNIPNVYPLTNRRLVIV